MPDDTAALIQRFADGVTALDRALHGLPAEAFVARSPAGGWSVGEVLAHLADSEILAAERFRRIVADPDATLFPLDQGTWAARLHYARRDPALAIATFRALRAANAELLRLLPPDAWARAGRHTVSGPTTLRQQVTIFADHTAEHLAQIAALRAALDAREAFVASPPSPEELAHLLDSLEYGITVIDEALAGLPPEILARRPTEGEWSIAEVLLHLGDSEIMGAERFRRIVADETPAVGWYDEARWAEELRYRQQSPWDALHLFRTVRAANLRLLRAIPADAWLRSGTHSARGPLTLIDMAETYIEHTEDHAAQIIAIREHFGPH